MNIKLNKHLLIRERKSFYWRKGNWFIQFLSNLKEDEIWYGNYVLVKKNLIFEDGIIKTNE